MLVAQQEYSRELKMAAMREIDLGKSMATVARMYQLSPKRLGSGEARRTDLPRVLANGRVGKDADDDFENVQR
jgi:hypothetical protein